MKEKIYIVEDETDILELLCLNLESAGYRTRGFDSALPMLKKLESDPPKLLILDLMLPDMDGFEVCQKLKAEPELSLIPIIMLTARVDLEDRIKGLDFGADDYITKPFDTDELLARVRAVLRRASWEAEKNVLQITPDFKLDFNRFEAFLEQKRLDLTLTEFKIMQILTKRPGWVFSRSQILDLLWGTDKIVIERTVDVHIKNLRDKIGNYASMIKNVRGMGYKFEPQTDETGAENG